MGNQQVLAGVTVAWDDTKHNRTKQNIPRVRDGGRYKNYKKGDLKSNSDEFTPERVIVDLKLDFGDVTVPEVALDGVHLQIGYSGANPTLGWWNGANWVKFKQVTYTNAVADVTLPSKWPTDPAIGSVP